MNHRIEILERILLPEDGLLLGNGDLSVSIYQKAHSLVFRFGKGDVWDRRFDPSRDPHPPHIDEIAHGIRDEGWKCGPYGGAVEATKGTADPQRMREICQGCPPSYNETPFPCPKPVGEFSLHWPGDLRGFQMHQAVEIESGHYRFEGTWDGGIRWVVEAAVPPTPNVLAIRWTLTGWQPEHTQAQGIPPIWASLYRWADPSISEFQARFYADGLREIICGGNNPSLPPLPLPSVEGIPAHPYIEQRFYPETTFPEGFTYRLIPFAPADFEFKPLDAALLKEARIQLFPAGIPALSGWFAVGVATCADPLGLTVTFENLIRAGAKGGVAVEGWFETARESAQTFWSKSSLQVAHPLIEQIWHETLHASRCAYRAGCVPPGLFLPSSLADYSHWHGDYHTNYNYQSPFWGDYTANHVEIGDAYFDGMKFMLQAGELIARRYYNARGAFIQLTNYPFVATEDPLGAVPMGRMAYMTGWMADYYWTRYRYSMDKKWLEKTGYPALKACALFYLDFLKKEDDGIYHSFPSNQGEDGFTGDPLDFSDKPQVNQHIRYGLRIAIKAARILKVDSDLCQEWLDRLENLAGDGGGPPHPVPPLDEEIGVPEFSRDYVQKLDLSTAWPTSGHYLHDWYMGQYPWMLMQAVRASEYPVDEMWKAFVGMIQRWRHPNGLMWAMSVGRYGHVGGWTESLGIIAPLQEMMLQSWSGVIRIFPAWPRTVDCAFFDFRAEGAFLVTARCSQGQVGPITIQSERGGLCRVEDPFEGRGRIQSKAGASIPFVQKPGRILEVETQAGQEIRVAAPCDAHFSGITKDRN
jgi:hypothetical protein